MHVSSSGVLGERLEGGRHLTIFVMKKSSRVNFVPARTWSRYRPALPTNGRPVWSSCLPGPSPMIMTLAEAFPSPGTAVVRDRCKGQAVHTRILCANSSSLLAAAFFRATTCGFFFGRVANSFISKLRARCFWSLELGHYLDAGIWSLRERVRLVFHLGWNGVRMLLMNNLLKSGRGPWCVIRLIVIVNDVHFARLFGGLEGSICDLF